MIIDANVRYYSTPRQRRMPESAAIHPRRRRRARGLPLVAQAGRWRVSLGTVLSASRRASSGRSSSQSGMSTWEVSSSMAITNYATQAESHGQRQHHVEGTGGIKHQGGQRRSYGVPH